MVQILLTGATGFVGDALVPALLADGYQLVCYTRDPEKAAKRFGSKNPNILYITNLQFLDQMPKYVINLSGEGIADRRWTDQRKRLLSDSRIGVTEDLVKRLNQLPGEPSVVVSGSAVGYYGSSQSEEFTEDNNAGQDFAARLCSAWEASVEGLDIRQAKVYRLRIGVVLGRPGGFLGRLERPFVLGLGGPLGHGRQMFSWIHRDDLVSMIRWFLNKGPEPGAYNAVSPNPVSNYEFTKTLGEVLRRPTVFRVPEIPMRLILGELSDLLFKGQAVIPKRASDEGFEFEYPVLKKALTQLFS